MQFSQRSQSGQRQSSIQQKEETRYAFALRLEDWDCINHQIITWLCNISTSFVSIELEDNETTKDV
jgi:hypothetical protein